MPKSSSDAPSRSGRKYRIGDYARHMGVGPDFLKHYEKAGLLEAEHQDNGYRYFGFEQSGQMLECMRLRNCGFTLREIEELLFERSGEDVIEALRTARERMEKRLQREQAIVSVQKRMEAWLAARKDKPEDWEIRHLQGAYYLPHTVGSEFIENPQIHEILQEWIDWMPVAKSSLRFSVPSNAPGRLEYEWGFVMKESTVKKHGISINDAVEYIPPAKYLVYHYGGPGRLDVLARLERRDHPMFEVLEELGLRIMGKCYMELFMSARRKSVHEGYGIFRIPVGK